MTDTLAALHREVNRTLKRDTPYSYEEVCQTYESYRAGCLTAAQKKLNDKLGRENGCTEAKEGRKKVRSSLQVNPIIRKGQTQKCAPALITQDACKSDVHFTREDFDSPDGMQTAMWGCLMWTVIHAVSFSIPVNPSAQQRSDYLTGPGSASGSAAALGSAHCLLNLAINREVSCPVLLPGNSPWALVRRGASGAPKARARAQPEQRALRTVHPGGVVASEGGLAVSGETSLSARSVDDMLPHDNATSQTRCREERTWTRRCKSAQVPSTCAVLQTAVLA